MPRRSEFVLDGIPLHQKNRTLRMTKVYTGQRFTSQTVLTDDVFTYVSFFFSSHRKAMKFVDHQNQTKYSNPNQYGYEFYWKQSEIFYRAAQQMPIEAAPVAAYYCMLNAAKSYLSYTSESVDAFVEEFGLHGLNEDNNDLGEDISTISIKHKQKGVFPLFANSLDADFLSLWPLGISHTLKSLLYNLPFVHRTFSMTYSSRSSKVDELFIPLTVGDMPKYYRGNDGKAYLAVDLDRSYFPPNAQTIPSGTLAMISSDFVPYNNAGLKLISTAGVRYNSNSISNELKELNDNLRKNFSYIRGAKRLWYLKKTRSTTPGVLNLCNLTINMAAMHRLSEIARYKPEQLNRLMHSKENWLIHEFISQSLDQFIDELAAQITKQDIMGINQK